MFYSKKACAFLLGALFLVFSGYAQVSAEKTVPLLTENSAEETFPSDDASAENAIPLGEAADGQQERSSRFGTFFLFLRMIIVLGIVVACIYAVMWFMKKSIRGDSAADDPFLRKVSSVDLAVGKSVQVVTLLDHAYIVGVSDNSVNLIGEVSDKELVDAMNLYADEHQNVKKPRTFSDILDIFMPNGPKDNGGILSGTQAKVSELLKRQHDRLNGGE